MLRSYQNVRFVKLDFGSYFINLWIVRKSTLAGPSIE